MSDECNLLAAWRSADLGSTLCVYLTDKVAVAAVADDIDVYTLRLAVSYTHLTLPTKA